MMKSDYAANLLRQSLDQIQPYVGMALAHVDYLGTPTERSRAVSGLRRIQMIADLLATGEIENDH